TSLVVWVPQSAVLVSTLSVSTLGLTFRYRSRVRGWDWGRMGSGWFGLLAAGVAGIAVAQAPASPPQGPLTDPGQKTVRIVRTTVKPTIDGVVNESEWAGAARIDDLHQVNPVEYASASERSEIYLFYDDNALYVAAKMYQPPDSITANMLRQNG